MRRYSVILGAFLCTTLPIATALGEVDQPEVIVGVRLDASAIDAGVIETMAEMIARDQRAAGGPGSTDTADKSRRGAQGRWMVPSRRATYFPHSGEHNLVNEWGDTRMVIGFPRAVDFLGAYVAGQAGDGAWTRGIRVIGYLGDREVKTTEWFEEIGDEPTWFDMDLRGVDRIVIEAVPVLDGGGWYALDDLTYRVLPMPGAGEVERTVVLDFEDAGYGRVLTGSDYAGLIWHLGSGDFESAEGIPAPQTQGEIKPPPADMPGLPVSRGGLGTPPRIEQSFQGPVRGDAGQFSYPPDTCGAIGPDHFASIVNRNFSVYNKATGVRVVNITLNSLFSPYATNGDPRVLFDQHSQRWIALSTTFSSGATIQLAVSTSSDPTGTWFKTQFLANQGTSSSCWPDYPTLGADPEGIYISTYLVGCDMSAFVIDKAPLIDLAPSLGAVTAFHGLPYEQAIQPVHTYGTPTGEFLISRISSTALRVREVVGPRTSPSLLTRGSVTIPSHSSPPDAPALGSSTPLDTVDTRLMNAVYRDGFIWTAHAVNVGGRAACRWYQVNPHASPPSLVQTGTISDSELYYFFPSIAVNHRGDVAMGFSGSSASQYAGAYVTGRSVLDPPGEMAEPLLLKAGVAAQNNLDSFGRNRWGDYSLTSLDPADELLIWTIQEYGHATNIWGTWIARLSLGDCNDNGVPDEIDISGSTSSDCNVNSIPDECEVVSDCNSNGVLDECDIASGPSQDCNQNSVPDECDIASGLAQDCNDNSVPDGCDIAPGGASDDCNLDGLPDDCQLTANDCDGNGRPDECDSADLATTIIAPANAQSCPGESVNFAVSAPGATAFQWLRNGAEPLSEGGGFSGTSTATLTIDPAGAGGDLSTYRCQVSFGCVDATSVSATLHVLPTMPELALVSQSPISGCAAGGQTVVFTVQTDDPDVAFYQWSKDGIDLVNDSRISGAQAAQLQITNAVGADSGEYECRVWNPCIDETEAVSTIGVLAFLDPAFTQHPADDCAEPGQNAMFHAAADTPASFVYRWYEGGALLSDGPKFSGTQTDTLTVLDAQLADDGRQFRLRAIVTNPFCSTFSESATLTVPSTGVCATCQNAPGDMDGDGDFDLIDMQHFAGCFGADVLVRTDCACANVDDANDLIDLTDWSALNAVLTGPQ